MICPRLHHERRRSRTPNLSTIPWWNPRTLALRCSHLIYSKLLFCRWRVLLLSVCEWLPPHGIISFRTGAVPYRELNKEATSYCWFSMEFGWISPYMRRLSETWASGSQWELGRIAVSGRGQSDWLDRSEFWDERWGQVCGGPEHQWFDYDLVQSTKDWFQI